jgi:hypothetical protein
MLNPLVTVIIGQVSHPFAGGKKAKNITLKHRKLIWECMLGTVYAADPAFPNREEKYFDYDYQAAHLYAKVAQCTDLRVWRTRRGGRLALYGIPPQQGV